MYLQSLFALSLLGLPLLASAQTGLNGILVNLAIFIDNTLIPFLFGIAFLFFVINVVRFFVLGSSNEQGRENARNLLMYSVLAFVFLLIFWGMIGLLTSSLGFTRFASTEVPCSDYIDKTTGCKGNPSGMVGGGTLGPGGGGPGSGFGSGTDYDDSSGFPSGGGWGGESSGSPTPVQPTNQSVPSDVIDAIANAAEIKEAVQTTAADYIDSLDQIYDWRITRIIEDAVAAINDPNATNQERAIAAIRLTNNKQMTTSDLSKYVSALNAEQRTAGQPDLNMSNLRLDAMVWTEKMNTQTNSTKSSLLPVIAQSHRSWYDWGEANEAAQAAAQQDLDYIYSPNLSDVERIAAFDNIVSKGSFPSDDTIPNLRIRLINDTNGERFFQGKDPLSAPGQTLNTPG